MSAFTPAPPARYAAAAIFLHWAIAGLLFFQLSLGWRLETLTGLPQFAAYQVHKTIGFSILLLSLARLAVRLIVRRPAPVRASPPQRFLAGAVHALLYVVMIGGPLTGWIMVSTAKVKVQTMFLGLIPWPHLPLGPAWNLPADRAHGMLAFLFVVLVVLHVAGALWHHMQRDDVLGRMMPARVRSPGALSMAALLAILAGAGLMTAAKWLPFGTARAPEAATEMPSPDNAAVALNLASNAMIANESANTVTPANAAAAEPDEPAQAVATPWQVEAGGSLGFAADYSGSAVQGTFRRWDAQIVFGADDLPNSRIVVTVDLASVDSADSSRDDTLRGDGFFDVATHPRAVFRSSRIVQRAGKGYRAEGTLSLHGQSRPLTLDFTLDIEGDKASASGSAVLKRTDYGVGTGEWADTGTIADAVSISFRLKARRGN